MCGAAAALAGVLLLGARKGKYGPGGQINAIPGCNLPLAALGTLILWLGWFGFNGGSELKVSDVGEANAVALVFVNTNMAAAGGLVFALLLSRFWFGKADLTMALNGALAGLVAITAEPLTPAPIEATLLDKVTKRIGELLGTEAVLIGDWFDDATNTILDSVTEQIKAAKPGAILVLENTRKYKVERMLWDAKPEDAAKLAPTLAKVANEFATKIAKVYVNEALSAGSLDTSTTVVPSAMDRVALGNYVAGEFDGPMRKCLLSEVVVFSGLKIDKLDDLQAMIDRGTIKWVFAAGSLAMALRKADGQLNGKPVAIGAAEDPSHSDKPYYIPDERVEQAKRMLTEGQTKGITFVLPIDSILEDGRAVDVIGPGEQQFDIGPKTSELFEKKVGEFLEKNKARLGKDNAPVVFHNGVFGMFEDPRFEAGTKKFVSQLKRLKDAGAGLYRRRRRGQIAREVRPTRLGHAYVHRRRHGAERAGQQPGAVPASVALGGQKLITNARWPGTNNVRTRKGRR